MVHYREQRDPFYRVDAARNEATRHKWGTEEHNKQAEAEEEEEPFCS